MPRTWWWSGCRCIRAPTSLAEDADRETARSKAGVTAQLYEDYPIRFWDHYLGPREDHLFLLDIHDVVEGGRPVPVDLTPDAGRSLDETAFDLLPDGSAVVTGWMRWPDLVSPTQDLVHHRCRHAGRAAI